VAVAKARSCTRRQRNAHVDVDVLDRYHSFCRVVYSQEEKRWLKSSTRTRHGQCSPCSFGVAVPFHRAVFVAQCLDRLMLSSFQGRLSSRLPEVYSADLVYHSLHNMDLISLYIYLCLQGMHSVLPRTEEDSRSQKQSAEAVERTKMRCKFAWPRVTYLCKSDACGLGISSQEQDR
jgi:hypothetical protein